MQKRSVGLALLVLTVPAAADSSFLLPARLPPMERTGRRLLER